MKQGIIIIAKSYYILFFAFTLSNAFVPNAIRLSSIKSLTESSTSTSSSIAVARTNCESEASSSTDIPSTSTNRRTFFHTATVGTTVAGVVSCTLSPFLLIPAQPCYARGRATLEYAYDRYYPRLEAGGNFYLNDLKKAIEKSDWAAIKAATQEPPKRSKSDKSKVDGGISERAAQAGGFSNARVIAAAELWAASFSDNSISVKTKAMKEQTAILQSVVEDMNKIAKIALGEEKAGGGGLFGFGAKAPSQTELAKEIRELYIKGGNAWNQYVFLANDDLPIQLKRLPYL